MSTPGWFTDPADPAGERWWDGASWSDRTRAAPPASEAVAPIAPPHEPVADDPGEVTIADPGLGWERASAVRRDAEAAATPSPTEPDRGAADDVPAADEAVRVDRSEVDEGGSPAPGVSEVPVWAATSSSPPSTTVADLSRTVSDVATALAGAGLDVGGLLRDRGLLPHHAVRAIGAAISLFGVYLLSVRGWYTWTQMLGYLVVLAVGVTIFSLGGRIEEQLEAAHRAATPLRPATGPDGAAVGAAAMGTTPTGPQRRAPRPSVPRGLRVHYQEQLDALAIVVEVATDGETIRRAGERAAAGSSRFLGHRVDVVGAAPDGARYRIMSPANLAEQMKFELRWDPVTEGVLELELVILDCMIVQDKVLLFIPAGRKQVPALKVLERFANAVLDDLESVDAFAVRSGGPDDRVRPVGHEEAGGDAPEVEVSPEAEDPFGWETDTEAAIPEAFTPVSTTGRVLAALDHLSPTEPSTLATQLELPAEDVHRCIRELLEDGFLRRAVGDRAGYVLVAPLGLDELETLDEAEVASEARADPDLHAGRS